MKVYVIVEYGEVHGVFESKAVAELLAYALGADIFERDLNDMAQSHLALVEEGLKNRIDETQKKVAADMKTLALLRGKI
jgi:hypothetical protein